MRTTTSSEVRGGRPAAATAEHRPTWPAVAVAGLGALIAVTSLLGPLALGLMRYRTSPTTLNQLLGSDAAALVVVAPLAVVAAVLLTRQHVVGALLAVGIGAFALYTYAQVVIGQEYLRLPGNVGVGVRYLGARRGVARFTGAFAVAVCVVFALLGALLTAIDGTSLPAIAGLPATAVLLGIPLTGIALSARSCLKAA